MIELPDFRSHLKFRSFVTQPLFNYSKSRLFRISDPHCIQMFVFQMPWALRLSCRNHLNTELDRYSKGRFVSGCQMVRYSNGGPKTRLKKAVSKLSDIWIFRQVTWLNHLNTGHPYCLKFRCSVFRWLLYSLFYLTPIFTLTFSVAAIALFEIKSMSSFCCKT